MNQQLREAHSTPYIRWDEAEKGECALHDASVLVVDEKENTTGRSLNMLNKRGSGTLERVHFNTGCSSSSTDLSKFSEFYKEAGDPDVTEEWMRECQRQKNEPVHQSSEESQQMRNSQQTLFSESSDSLLSHKAEPEVIQKRSVNRSMDVLPTINEGFYTLEKCVSAEFTPKQMIPPSRLCRSKEMPNIADVDDYE